MVVVVVVVLVVVVVVVEMCNKRDLVCLDLLQQYLIACRGPFSCFVPLQFASETSRLLLTPEETCSCEAG